MLAHPARDQRGGRQTFVRQPCLANRCQPDLHAARRQQGRNQRNTAGRTGVVGGCDPDPDRRSEGQGSKKNPLVELRGLEPLTPSLRSWAVAVSSDLVGSSGNRPGLRLLPKSNWLTPQQYRSLSAHLGPHRAPMCGVFADMYETCASAVTIVAPQGEEAQVPTEAPVSRRSQPARQPRHQPSAGSHPQKRLALRCVTQ
jgi:hypothetical protein